MCQSPFRSEPRGLAQNGLSARSPGRTGAATSAQLEPEIQALDIPPWAFRRYLFTPPDVAFFREQFECLLAASPDSSAGLLSGMQLKPWLEQSRLPTAVLHRVWNLADVTRDGYLDLYEFALANHFLTMKLDGFELPPFLPRHFFRSREEVARDRHRVSTGNPPPPLQHPDSLTPLSTSAGYTFTNRSGMPSYRSTTSTFPHTLPPTQTAPYQTATYPNPNPSPNPNLGQHPPTSPPTGMTATVAGMANVENVMPNDRQTSTHRTESPQLLSDPLPTLQR